MKKILSLFLIFAYMVCMVPVLADGTSANIDSVTVSGAALCPAFSPDVLSYDVVVDDENAALPELTITGQYELVKEAKALGDKTIVRASGTNYEFTYRAPYTKETTLTKAFVSTQHTAMSIAYKTYQSGNSTALMSNPEEATTSNRGYVPVYMFDFTDDTVNPFGKFEISLAFNAHVANIDAEIKAANSNNTWTTGTGSYNNIVAGDPAFDEDTKVSFNTNSAVKDGSYYVIKLDVSDMVREKLLKGDKKVSLAVKMTTVSSSQLKLYTEGAGSAKYKSTINYYDIVKGSDATIKSLKVNDGTLDAEFNPETLSYNVTGSRKVPTFEYVLSDSHANVEETLATGENQATVIKVTAADGTVKEYVFNIGEIIWGSANIASVNLPYGTLAPSFNSENSNYLVGILPGQEIPDISYTLADELAVANVVKANAIGEATTVTVTNGGNVKVYTFKFINAATSGDDKVLALSDIGKISAYSNDQKDVYQDYQKDSEDYMVQLRTNVANHADVWVKFDLTGKDYNPFGQFKFKFYSASPEAVGINYLVRTVSSSNWDGRNSENPSITYNNTLGNGMFYNEAYAQEIATGAAGYKEFDITEMVQAELAKGNEVITVAVALSGTPTSNVSMRFRNKLNYASTLSYKEAGVVLDSDATIQSVEFTNGLLQGSFSSAVDTYDLVVVDGVEPSVDYILSSEFAAAEVEANNNSIVIKVVAQDGSTKDYTFNFVSYENVVVPEVNTVEQVYNKPYTYEENGEEITTASGVTFARASKYFGYELKGFGMLLAKEPVELADFVLGNNALTQADGTEIGATGGHYGILFYGPGIKYNTTYYTRSYAIYENAAGVEKIVYGNALSSFTPVE